MVFSKINEETGEKQCCIKCTSNKTGFIFYREFNCCPNSHVEKSFDLCCIGCDKPGIGAVDHDPGNNSCNDCAILCCPCFLLMDIICWCPMVLKLYNVDEI